VSITLSYTDASDLAELISTMENAELPQNHTGSLRLYDPYEFHYATIEVEANGEAKLVLSPMQEVQDG